MRVTLLESPLRDFPFRLLPHFQHKAEELERTLNWEAEFISELETPKVSVVTSDDNLLTKASVENQSAFSKLAEEKDADFLLLLSKGTILHPSAVFILLKELKKCSAEIIYWDEIRYETGADGKPAIVEYSRKGEPGRLSILGRPLVGGAAIVKKSLVGPARDLSIEYLWKLSLSPASINHIPLALSFSSTPPLQLKDEEGMKVAISKALYPLSSKEISFQQTTFGPRTQVQLSGNSESLGVIIPFKNQSEHTIKALRSLTSQTVASRLHLRLIDNGSSNTEIENIKNFLSKSPFADSKIVSDSGYFNYARLNNLGLQSLRETEVGSFVFMNNDVEISSPDVLEQLALWSKAGGVGLVGGTLRYPGGRIQSAGINFSQVRPANISGASLLCDALREVDGLTFALALVTREVIETLDGLDEFDCPNGYGDVLFAEVARQHGFKSLHVPWLEAVHHESASRGRRPEELELLEMVRQGVPISDLWSDLQAARQPMYIPLGPSKSAFQSVVRKISNSPKLLSGAEAICRPLVSVGRAIKRVVP